MTADEMEDVPESSENANVVCEEVQFVGEILNEGGSGVRVRRVRNYRRNPRRSLRVKYQNQRNSLRLMRKNMDK